MRKTFFLWCVVAVSCLCVVTLSPTISLADTKGNAPSESLIKKAEKLRALIEEKKAQGVDVSEALKLDQISKSTAEKGDLSLAEKQLDAAISSLEGPPAQTAPATETAEPVSSDSLMKKAERLRSLVEESKSQMSEALKLDQMSRNFAEKGDFATANKLLDEAIKAMEGASAQTPQKAEAAEPVSSDSLMKKAEKLRSLIEENKAQGKDVSKVLKLDQMSRVSAERGDFATANKLLDEAIKSLPETAAKETSPGTGKDSASGSFIKKQEKLQALIEEKLDKGINASEAFKLDEMSRSAARNKNFTQASKMLDDAIKNLSARTAGDKPVKKSVKIPVSAETVVVTEGVPLSERGADVKDYASAFGTKTVQAKDGNVQLEIGYVPVFIEEAQKTPSDKTPLDASPFGIHPANTYSVIVKRDESNRLPPSKMGYTFTCALDIGAQWTRPEFYANWSFIQKTDKDLKEGLYDWKENDYVFGTTPKEIGIVGNIGGLEPRMMQGDKSFPRTFRFQNKMLEEKYVAFVKKLVERYDGDGVDDMPGLKNPVKYWQVDNEPDTGTQDTEGFAHLMEITAKAIKSACSDGKVIMGGLAQIETFDTFALPVLEKLRGQYVDVFDFHLYGPAGAWHYFKLSDRIKEGLAKAGYKNTEIWILETGTYCGKPHIGISGKPKVPEQTERHHAADLIKRHLYGLSLGIKKIFWAFGIVDGFTAKGDHEFDFMGLMYPRKSDVKGADQEVKKLGYYSYKLMTDKLAGCDFSTIESMNLGEGVYGYKLNRSGKPVYVVWVE